MRRSVRTKLDFVRRYKLGEFGNRSPTWENLNDALRDGIDRSGLYHIRNRVAGGPTWYDVPGSELEDAWRHVTKTVPSSSLYISQMAPTPLTLFQGEVRRWGLHYELIYATIQKPMRDALRATAQHANGVRATLLLQHYMDPSSYDDLVTLLDEYDNHIIEFSCYDTVFGTVPNRNTVFWEVRLSRQFSSNLSPYTEHF